MTCGLSEVCPDRNAEDVVVVLLAYANIQRSCKSMTTVLFQCFKSTYRDVDIDCSGRK